MIEFFTWIGILVAMGYGLTMIAAAVGIYLFDGPFGLIVGAVGLTFVSLAIYAMPFSITFYRVTT